MSSLKLGLYSGQRGSVPNTVQPVNSKSGIRCALPATVVDHLSLKLGSTCSRDQPYAPFSKHIRSTACFVSGNYNSERHNKESTRKWTSFEVMMGSSNRNSTEVLLHGIRELGKDDEEEEEVDYNEQLKKIESSIKHLRASTNKVQRRLQNDVGPTLRTYGKELEPSKNQYG